MNQLFIEDFHLYSYDYSWFYKGHKFTNLDRKCSPKNWIKIL